MDPDGNVLGYIILLFVLVLVNAFFAMSEMAVISVNDNKISRMAADGNKKAIKLLKLLESPTNFLSTIQVGVTISGFLASAVAADTFADRFVRAFSASLTFVTPATLRVVAIVLITIILSYVTLVLGELVPKRIAMQNPEAISFAIVGVLLALTAFLKPVVWLLSASTNGLLRLMGIDPNDQPNEVTEEEIRMMLDVGNERGNIEESEKHMIHNVFDFDDRFVEDIMTHRTEIVAVDIDTGLEEVLELAVETGYSRIPVYEEELDSVKGLVYVKDLIGVAISKPKEFNIQDYLRPALFVIETNTCKALLTKFQEEKIQLAIVVDEYGGTAGLVTMEDLLESIVGNIQDEYDDEEEEISKVNETTYIVDGLTPIEDVFEFFAIDEDEGDFDTIGGYILNHIGQIPSENEKPSVPVSNILFTVKTMDERRIDKLTAEILDMGAEEEEFNLEDAPKGIRERKDKS